MATITVSASALKYVMPPTSASWKERCYQGQYSGSSQKSGVMLFAKLRDGTVNWTNQRIISVALSCTYDGAGSNSEKTLGLYVGTQNAITGTGAAMRGTLIGNVATNGRAYNAARTIYFNSETNAAAFAVLAEWLVNGTTTTLAVWRNESDGGHSWSSNYLAIKAASMTIEYEAAGSYGDLSDDDVELGETVTLDISPVDTEGTITHTVRFSSGSKSATVMTRGSSLSVSYTIPIDWHDQITGMEGDAFCELVTYRDGVETATSIIPFRIHIPSGWSIALNAFSAKRYSSHLDDQGHTIYEDDLLGNHVWIGYSVSAPYVSTAPTAPKPSIKIVYTRSDDASITGQITRQINSATTVVADDRTAFSGEFSIAHEYNFVAIVSNGHQSVQIVDTVSTGEPAMHINKNGVTFGGFSLGSPGAPLMATAWPTYGFFDVAHDSGRQTKNYPNNTETSILSFSVPADGDVMVIGIAQFPTGTGGTFRFGSVKYTRNGAETEISAQTCPPQNNAGPRICMVGVYYAQAGDVINLRINQNSGAAVSGACELIVLRIGGIRLGL